MWTKTTLKEAERAILQVYASSFSTAEMRRKLRPILHQLAYDAATYGDWIGGEKGIDLDMGIDLDLIDRGPGKAQQEPTASCSNWEPYDDPRD